MAVTINTKVDYIKIVVEGTDNPYLASAILYNLGTPLGDPRVVEAWIDSEFNFTEDEKDDLVGAAMAEAMIVATIAEAGSGE